MAFSEYDFDAFYAQCESVRLGLPPTHPLAVQQWNAIIALNYPARAYGLSRGMSAVDAKIRCPDLTLQHVATWREGEPRWAYRENPMQCWKDDKAALDPYRRESRKAFALISECLEGGPVARIEKASVDEVFIDLSAKVYDTLKKKFLELRSAMKAPDDQVLPLPTNTELCWEASNLAGPPTAVTDWDDVAFNIGAEMVLDIRNEIYQGLCYTTSAGLAPNKLLAKLAAGYKKPNAQTVVLPSGIHTFLSPIEYPKLRGMARQLGEKCQTAFGGSTVSDLKRIPLHTLCSKLGSEQGSFVFRSMRGVDTSEVVPRLRPKSMLSQKTFVPLVKNLDEASRWLRMFAVELNDRVLELDTKTSRRRPRVCKVSHHINGRFGPTRSKQTTLSPASVFSEVAVYDCSLDLLCQLTTETEEPSWPCLALGVVISDFVELGRPNGALRNFFKVTPAKRKHDPQDPTTQPLKDIPAATEEVELETNPRWLDETDDEWSAVDLQESSNRHESSTAVKYKCPHCDLLISGDGGAVLEHLDWHVAADMQSSLT
ncbi:N-acetyltransferase eso1 [Recurvomyces mirabilis]|nr:N-acetyltransferase eso1 [Recurvomyces mirabilis]